MSSLVSGESRVQDVTDAVKGSIKCRIPQRLPPGRNKLPFTNVSKPKGSEHMKQKFEVVSAQSRFAAKNPARPSRPDEQTRPKSASRTKDDLYTGRFTQPSSRFPRFDRFAATPKKPSTLPKISVNETAVYNKAGRPFIMVPVIQRPAGKNLHTIKNSSDLPDQETIKKHEDLELRQSEISDMTNVFNESYDKESITSRSDKVMQLKINWQEIMVQFEKMKNELTDRQKEILELYAIICKTHQKMSGLGEKPSLPPAEELRIMNVTNLTPEQLLQLCAGLADRPQDAQVNLSIDVNKLYDVPTKLVETCEQTLLKRKEIIDWFESLKSFEKGISMHKLSKKLNEFNAENDMLKCSLDQVKAEFVKELEEIVNFLRKSVNETIALQLQSEKMTYELSELNSLNADLRKQIHNAGHLRSQANNTRIEELQKEVKEEKCKRLFLRDRLSRAEAQTKANAERASQLEAALEQAQSKTWTLERTVQQLHEQNKKLQSDFDKELKTLMESIREHTVHLEEIADAREKLQVEKEDLEKRLTELSEHYNESLRNVKHEMNINVVKLIETEKKYEKEKEEKANLESKIQSLCDQLQETEQHLRDAAKQVQEKEYEIEKMINVQKELEATKQELYDANLKIHNYINELTKQSADFTEIERNYKDSIGLQKTLRHDLATKEEYIVELEKKQSLLEQQLQANESKMEAYVEQLSSLKGHITQLQEDFGEFENLNELHEKINLQRSQLLEATRQNGELVEALQKKEEEIEQFSASFAEQENIIEQRNAVIKMLSEKEEEQTNIIKILRNNLELRSQADNNISHELVEKNAEIDALLCEIDTSKQQITDLEKIILTLQDKTRKASMQKKKDKDTIAMLKSKIAEYEAYHFENSETFDVPGENLDSLIKIFEEELGPPMEPRLNYKDHEYATSKKNHIDKDRRRDKLEFKEEVYNASQCQKELGQNPVKIVTGVKKTYIPANDDQHKGDLDRNLSRKKAITSMNTKKMIPSLESDVDTYNPPTTIETNLPTFNGEHQKLSYLTRHLQYMSPQQFRDDKKFKMFKLAGHRL